MTDKYIPANDKAALTALVDDAKAASLRLASDMLRALSPAGQQMLVDLQDAAWRIGLEVTADVYGVPRICLVAVSSTGERRPVVTVAQGAPADAH